MARGTLRVYLGAAPGVGKTFAMLNEGRRRRDRGADVVVGFVETHGRARTAEQIGDLEVIPRRTAGLPRDDLRGDGRRRHPRPPTRAVALVDELAHTNVPGSRNAKRWQDVSELLERRHRRHLHRQHPAPRIAQRRRRAHHRRSCSARRSPTTIVRAADQVELVDMTPEALRRRMAHGNIYAAEKVDAALANYFREGNLAALRGARPALGGRPGRRRPRGVPRAPRHHRAVGDPGTGRRRHHRRARHRGTSSAAPPGSPSEPTASSSASTSAADEGLAGPATGLLDGPPPAPGRARRRVSTRSAASDIAAALIDFARAENATQLVLGAAAARAAGTSSRRDRSSTASSASPDRSTSTSSPTRPHRRRSRSPACQRRRGGRRSRLVADSSPGSSRSRRLPAAHRCSCHSYARTSACRRCSLLYLLLVVTIAGRRRPGTSARSPRSPGSSPSTGTSLLRSTPGPSREGENVLALIVFLLTRRHRQPPRRRSPPAAPRRPPGPAPKPGPSPALAGGMVEADPLPDPHLSTSAAPSGSPASHCCDEPTTAGPSKPPTAPASIHPTMPTRSTP